MEIRHDTNTCPDEDCPECIRGCLGCGSKYVRTINGYCASCVESEAWRKPPTPTSERPFFKGCCRHAAPVHDQYGCTVDISTNARCYWRCHGVDEKAVDPRWRDYHTLPDEWFLRPVTRWFYRRKRVLPDDTVQYPFRLKWLVILLSRYSLRHFHCHLDGQCIFRAGHRGSCSWGADDE